MVVRRAIGRRRRSRRRIFAVIAVGLLISVGILIVAWRAQDDDGWQPGDIGKFAAQQVRQGDWLIHRIPCTLKWSVTQTAEKEKHDGTNYINRTATANIQLIVHQNRIDVDSNHDGVPDIDTRSMDTARDYAKAGLASVQGAVRNDGVISGQKFGYGSRVSDPVYGEYTWEDSEAEVSGSVGDGDSIYLVPPKSGETRGEERVGDGGVFRVLHSVSRFDNGINLVESKVNKNLAKLWFWNMPFRGVVQLKNPINEEIMYETEWMPQLKPIYLPFDPDLDEGETETTEWERDFTITVLTPFGFAGKYLYNVGIQGLDITTHKTQMTEEKVVVNDAWGWLGIVGGCVVIVAAVAFTFATTPFTLGTSIAASLPAIKVGLLMIGAGAAILAVNAALVDPTARDFDWGTEIKETGDANWLFALESITDEEAQALQAAEDFSAKSNENANEREYVANMAPILDREPLFNTSSSPLEGVTDCNITEDPPDIDELPNKVISEDNVEKIKYYKDCPECLVSVAKLKVKWAIEDLQDLHENRC